MGDKGVLPHPLSYTVA